MQGFETLTPDELHLLEDTPALITVLIGGADGDLDREERTWSERLLRSRTYNKPAALNEYYSHVAEQFWAKIHAFMVEMPKETAQRNALIVQKLEPVSAILEKLEPTIAYGLYKGFRTLAEETAKSSGGFLRIGAIGEAELEWMHLPMLTPVAAPANWQENIEEEEEEG
jgi:hypothetical protein